MVIKIIIGHTNDNLGSKRVIENGFIFELEKIIITVLVVNMNLLVVLFKKRGF